MDSTGCFPQALFSLPPFSRRKKPPALSKGLLCLVADRDEHSLFLSTVCSRLKGGIKGKPPPPCPTLAGCWCWMIHSSLVFQDQLSVRAIDTNLERDTAKIPTCLTQTIVAIYDKSDNKVKFGPTHLKESCDN